MKQILILDASIVIFTPCLAVLNENGSFIPNIIGFIYIGFLAMLFRTKYDKTMKRFVDQENKNNEEKRDNSNWND